MSEMKWTSGPWKCKRSATGSWLIVPEDYPSFKICRIENAITYIMDFDDAAEADAHLIAAAPDLYEVLARWEQNADWLYDTLENQTCSDLCDKTYEQQGCPTGTCAREDGLKHFRDAVKETRTALAKARMHPL